MAASRPARDGKPPRAGPAPPAAKATRPARSPAPRQPPPPAPTSPAAAPRARPMPPARPAAGAWPPVAPGPPQEPWAPPGGDGHDLNRAGRPRITWSSTELVHLAMGVAAITVCFALIRASLKFPDRILEAFTDGWGLVASFVAVTTGFVLHELAHKVVAQRFGHWAEFRADVRYLLAGVAIAAFAPFFVAAPGAVWIQGRPPRRQYGLISLVGPGVNLLVAGLAFGLYQLLLAVDPHFGQSFATHPDKDPLALVLAMVAMVNAILAVFNLIPFHLPFLGTLDGLKVWRWSRLVWLAAFAVAIGLLVAVYIGPGAPGANLFPLE